MFNNDFLNLKNKEFILYGASIGGQNVYEYLKDIGFEKQVIGFVDSNKLKHGSDFCGTKIYSPEYILKNESAIIVISSMYYKAVFNSIKNIHAFNPVYAHINFMPANMDLDNSMYTKEEVEQQYDDSTPYTSNIIEACFYFRNADNCKIQSIEKVLDYSGSDYYWCDDDFPSLAYDKLTICDIGAFTGDTLQMFHKRYGKRIKRYYGFEPNLASFRILEKYANEVSDGIDIQLFQCGLGDIDSMKCSVSNNMVSHFADKNQLNEMVSVKKLDSIPIKVDGKLCIKMDLEGYEMSALAGAAETIKQYKPELAVCVYHKASDIIRIPSFIKAINKDYEMIIRGGVHMICFAR